jgi:hypothetical protein
MRIPSAPAVLAATTVGLAACVSAAPLQLPDDHPASPAAAAGLIDIPTAIAGYKSPDDFMARSAADTNAPAGGRAGMRHDSGGMAGMQRDGMDHAAMPGMSHGGGSAMDHSTMPGMRHEGAPHGADSQ